MASVNDAVGSLSAYEARVVRKLRGTIARNCPCCGFAGMFRAFGHPPRYDAKCPSCDALERHRLLTIILRRSAILRRTDRLLHFAPEPVIAHVLRDQVAEYRTADIRQNHADRVLDIENIDLADGSFDAVLASHVLEHVDDRRALAELRRILTPNGLLLLMVPIVEGWNTTYEDVEVTSDEGREVHFGQKDHVRLYGRDFRERVAAAGFGLTEFGASGEECVRHGLLRGERIFLARAV